MAAKGEAVETWVTLTSHAGCVVSASVGSPLSGAVYTLVGCADDVGCCDCPEGVQGKVCKHHVAVLQFLHVNASASAAFKHSFQNLLIDKLGTNFGRPSGCSLGLGGLAALNAAVLQLSPAAGTLTSGAAAAGPSSAVELAAAAASTDSIAASESDLQQLSPARSLDLQQLSPARLPMAAAPRPAQPTPSKRFVALDAEELCTSLQLPDMQRVLSELSSPARRHFYGAINNSARQLLSQMNTAAANDERETAAMSQAPTQLAPARASQRSARCLGAAERSRQPANMKRKAAVQNMRADEYDSVPDAAVLSPLLPAPAPSLPHAAAAQPPPDAVAAAAAASSDSIVLRLKKKNERTKPRTFAARLDKKTSKWPLIGAASSQPLQEAPAAHNAAAAAWQPHELATQPAALHAGHSLHPVPPQLQYMPQPQPPTIAGSSHAYPPPASSQFNPSPYSIPWSVFMQGPGAASQPPTPALPRLQLQPPVQFSARGPVPLQPSFAATLSTPPQLADLMQFHLLTRNNASAPEAASDAAAFLQSLYPH
jgi:hypothetical protein